MNAMSWSSIGYYCIFSVFVYYQQLHGRDFKGSRVAFGTVLSLCGLLGMVIGFAYFIYYGWTVSWLGAIAAFFIGLTAMIPALIIERFVGALTLSLVGFLVWPFCAYMMFHHLPN
jgi:hypothetical protein